MLAFMGEIERLGDDLQIAFDPPDFQEVFVCEFALIQGDSSRELILKYLDRYPACFSVRQLGERRYVIKPNERSGMIGSSEGQWTCMCP
jgi:hypothetical protein